jgi:hypothetical protein
MLEVQTAVVNNPTFIELQDLTLKTFLGGDYKFTVFNDSKQFPDYSNFGDPSVHGEIRRTCERLNIQCIDISNPSHQWNQCAANRCADAMNSLLRFQKENPGKYLVIDSDMFLIHPTSADHFDLCDAAIVPQVRSNEKGATVKYAWNGIHYFNTGVLKHHELLNWRNNDVEGVWTDVGGAMHYWIQNNERTGENRIREIPHLWSCKWSFDSFPPALDSRWLSFFMTDPRNPTDGSFYSELYDERFLHFRAGGNWEKKAASEYNTVVQNLKNAVTSICKN